MLPQIYPITKDAEKTKRQEILRMARTFWHCLQSYIYVKPTAFLLDLPLPMAQNSKNAAGRFRVSRFSAIFAR